MKEKEIKENSKREGQVGRKKEREMLNGYK
jgi:hypothetical protein